MDSPLVGAGLGSGPIRPGDIVDVRIFDAPEFSTSMPVSPSGDIVLPYAGIFHIDGMTSVEAAKAIAIFFADLKILRDPHVIVMTRQFGNTISIFGEVRDPGHYPLKSETRLIDALSEAGGITDRAGHVIELYEKGTLQNPQSLLWDPTFRENENLGIKVKEGQTVVVTRCGVVFIGGNVTRPGAFPLCNALHTTLSQVLAMAGGIKPSSWGQRTLLMRSSGTGTRIVETIQLEDVLRGKKPDLLLQTDDIIFIPPSSLKAGLKTAATLAVAFATQAYFYAQNR